MKCGECFQEVGESEIVDDVEYFVCGNCGWSGSTTLKPVPISVAVLHRKGGAAGGGSAAERFSSDFVVDGQSLFQILAGSGDVMGCFVSGEKVFNERIRDQLLLKLASDVPSGRVLLYVCPECTDIGCGAFGCVEKKERELYIWESFAYENGYESPRIVGSFGPFRFLPEQYESAISIASAL